MDASICEDSAIMAFLSWLTRDRPGHVQATVIALLLERRHITMPTPSPTTHSTSQLSQAREKGKLLPCIEFLKTHFEYGGVDQKGFDILYHMIEMISAVGWEVHVIYQSKITTTRIVEKIQWYLDCLLQGCGMFHSNMQKAFKRAKDAAEKLPDVSDWSDDTLETKLIQWRWKLK